MSHFYPYQSKRFIREAQKSLDLMVLTNSIDELKRTHVSFLNSSRFSTHQLVIEMNKVDGFKEWWANKGEELDKNELFTYFKRQRNNVTKGGDDVICVDFEIKDINIDGPLQISDDGILIGKIGKNGPEWVPFETNQLKILSWDFKNKPNNFINMPAIEMCKKYVIELEKIIDEVALLFSKFK